MILAIIVALIAALSVFFTTRHYYVNRIKELVIESNIRDNKTFHKAFKVGWDDGMEYGQRKANLERIVKETILRKTN
jgi:hypothetical protein